MSIYDEPKIDCHVHLLDPARFPYAPQAWYHPIHNEQSSARQLTNLFDAYGVSHALLVGPNSGYDTDNRCLVDAIAQGNGRYRGVAVVDNATSLAELKRLRDGGIVGTTMQVSLLGVDFFRGTSALLESLAELDMFLDLQVEGDQLVQMAPIVEPSGVRIMIDHCGRPDPAAGLTQAGFEKLLEWGSIGRYFIKVSGLVKVGTGGYPWRAAWPYVHALLEAFTPDRSMWGSDWPFLRAPERLDYGPMLTLIERLIPNPEQRRKVLWDTPRRLFGYGAQD